MFRTKYDDRDRYYSECGSHFEPVYNWVVNEDGVEELTQVGETDIYSEIQSYRDSCDLSIIINRILDGSLDASDFCDAGSNFVDMVDMPKNYAELFQRQKDCENIFYQLDPKVREHFNNDCGQFWSQFGSSDFNDFMSSLNNPQDVEKPVDNIVKDGDSVE